MENGAKFNQEKVVLTHLLTTGSITSWQAIEKYGITRVSQYIYLLAKKGYKFKKVTHPNSKGNGWYTQYILIDEGEEECTEETNTMQKSKYARRRIRQQERIFPLVRVEVDGKSRGNRRFETTGIFYPAWITKR